MIATSLLELVDLIGPAATLRLTEKFGGERLHISTDPAADGILAAAIGADAAHTLSVRFLSQTIEVPAAHGMRARYHRNCGMNDGAIAVRLGITPARVADLLR